ncbi:ribosome biogenesis GTPase Der [Candidatus Coxiella mudrowiae]|uniref:ribosome biogenesis GTPase Der n=1 Tax=Candidatus Coxiella mudrowiae TaxID=2054173 RepID=UPI000C292214|nr:ribosome biogenesis GTPase Der [Candidatus Coxiella mudrowiae]
MLPVIAIVGRPNVGKSTLFNYLTRSRAALVADVPGVTRDRQYGEVRIGSQPILVVDTGGLVDSEEPAIAALAETQVDQAIEESDCTLFLVDAKTGLTRADEIVAERLRKKNKKIFFVVNKADGTEAETVRSEFYRLGFNELYVISAKKGRGIKRLMTSVLSELTLEKEVVGKEILEKEPRIKIAVIGRPNVGKSTLINRLLGEERLIVYNQPGTTRDSIYIPFVRRDKNYTLIDTAGIRRRARIHNQVEKISIIKSMQAMHVADVIIFVLNARESVSEQDLRLLNLIIKASGVPLVIAINKWDSLENDEREQVKQDIDRRMSFIDFARLYFISALEGTGLEKLFRAIEESYQSTQQELTTSQLTKTLEKAVLEHEPPLVKGRRIRLRFAHLGSRHPLTIVIHGKQTQSLPQSYSRYLANYFRKTFNFIGVPVYIKLKTDPNPYEEA